LCLSALYPSPISLRSQLVLLLQHLLPTCLLLPILLQVGCQLQPQHLHLLLIGAGPLLLLHALLLAALLTVLLLLLLALLLLSAQVVESCVLLLKQG
jgi:hypothetical protein